MLRELRQEMFTAMVEAKDITQAPVYYDPGFLLYTNGQVQDYERGLGRSGRMKVRS
ncbi:MAG TPA: hypothetical protein VGI00_10075 [Streptosporangiaceae bacterium]|jgi:hypothetical protein